MTAIKSDFAFAKVELRNLYSKQQQLSWGIGKNCESTMYHRGATKNYRQTRPRVIFWLTGLMYERPNLTKTYLAIWNGRYYFYIEVRPQSCGSYLWRRPFYVLCRRRRLLLLLDSCYLRGRFVRGEIGHKLTLHIPYPLPSYSSLASHHPSTTRVLECIEQISILGWFWFII
jgi:hypothetical protein